jgi:hypothetical protein
MCFGILWVRFISQDQRGPQGVESVNGDARMTGAHDKLIALNHAV